MPARLNVRAARADHVRRRLLPVGVLAALAALIVVAGQVAQGAPEPAPATRSATASARVAPVATARHALPLGAGLLSFPDEADRWVQANPADPRAGVIASRIANQPTALWLTGDESFGNLAEAVQMATASDRTMLLTLYNIPLRYDGLSSPSTLSLRAYKQWVTKVASMIGRTRAIVVVEPDALWFYDRMPSDASRAQRLTALRFVVSTLASKSPRTRVYLDAGTSSGSVTPDRMATLLLAAGVSRTAGYAVDVSSYAPTTSIQAYAQRIRSALQAHGVRDPRYVTDTGRNGASTWDNNWCNPPEQRLGTSPRVLAKADGRDFALWIKAPGTSDGDCGPVGGGAGTYGGEFLPQVAYDMATG